MTAREEVLVNVGRGIQLCCDQTGDPADPPILLIAGLGQQLHSCRTISSLRWPAGAIRSHGSTIVTPAGPPT